MQNSVKAYREFQNGHCSLDDVYKILCQNIVNETGATRASIWLFSQDGTKIICQILFDKRTLGFTRGTVLSEEDYPDYFNAIQRTCMVNAPEAVNHVATKSFSESYFYPNSIVSLLDLVMLKGTTPIGVLCCENCGEIKEWSRIDEDYLSKQAALLGLIHSKIEDKILEMA